MKTSVVLYFCLLPFLLSAQQFTNPGNRWYTQSFNFIGHISYTVYRFNPDQEEVNGQFYYELQRTNDTAALHWVDTGLFMREDTIGQVFAIAGDGSDPFLLYDFQAAVELEGWNEDGSCPMTLQQTDTLELLNGELVQQFEYNLSEYNSPLQVLAGIGALSSPMYPWNNCLFDAIDYLNCFSRNDTLLYRSVYSSANPCFQQPVSVEAVNIHSAKVFPNLLQQGQPLQITTEVPVEWKLFDQFGRVVYQEMVYDQSQTDLTQKGLHFYQLWLNGKLLRTGKVIVY